MEVNEEKRAKFMENAGKRVNKDLKEKIIKKVINDDVPQNVDKMF